MTALALKQEEYPAVTASVALEPTSLKEVWRFGEIVCASGLAPKSVRSPEAATIIVMTGRELGLTAMQSLRSIHVVDGKPLLSADLMLALVKRHKDCEFFTCTETTGKVATFVAKRRGEPEQRLSFTIEQASAAGLTGKDNWRKYPDAMLRARAIAALARMAFPDAFVGVYEEDEIQAPRRVESDVRAVPDARPTPAPESGPREADVSLDHNLDTIKFDLNACSSAAEVETLLAKLVALKLPKDHPRRVEMLKVYEAARASVRAAETPEREPGEEG